MMWSLEQEKPVSVEKSNGVLKIMLGYLKFGREDQIVSKEVIMLVLLGIFSDVKYACSGRSLELTLFEYMYM